MLIRTQEQTRLCVDFEQRCITSLCTDACELLAGQVPLFTLRMRNRAGEAILTDAYDATLCRLTEDGAVYSGFSHAIEAEVRITGSSLADWSLSVTNHTDLVIEWVDFPCISLKPLRKNGGDASILLPYNEGVLIEDALLRQNSWFPHCDPEYPSHGSYYTFPYMISSQFMCYLTDSYGLYFGAHDTARGVKGLQCYPQDANASSVRMHFRLFTGCHYGQDYICDFPVTWHAFRGSWYDGAALYKSWLNAHLPARAVKICENPSLPDWYADSPLVISYPVRGIHDMDIMEPNSLFPYENAMPMIEEIAAVTGCRILVLLMHWEGTAPWAPPYVWPPFGGEECLNRFLDRLHARGHLLGVYCSGFGWTLKSNLLDSYDNTSEYEQQQLDCAMCASPSGEITISRICTGQRSGYDLCAASSKAREILDQAYRPLLQSGLDYAQILDQNHGGSQYFCYSTEHGHPPVPGSWMTANMQHLLSSWNETAGSLLLGCESAAAEPYIGNLLFSDNRYELNWHIGQPVPLYSFLYHEYLRNFMGNQVCCAFSNQADTMCMRLAYSFTAGDCLTLVMTPDGELMNNWGCHDFSRLPDKQRTLLFLSRLRRFYQEQAGIYLYRGNMIKPLAYTCEEISFPSVTGRQIPVPTVLSTAWEADGHRVQIFVNHTEKPVTLQPDPRSLSCTDLTIPALDALMLPLS